MTPRIWRAGLLLVLAGVTLAAQLQADARRPVRNPDDLLHLPNEKLLTYFTAGTSPVIADLLWVQCCTYVGRQVQTTFSFRWLHEMLETVVRLDPYFVDAYRYGGIFLAALRADDTAALNLLHRGMVKNPQAWELPYEAAMVHMLNRREAVDSRYNAALYLAMAVETGNAPVWVAELAGALQQQTNLTAVEADMWEKLSGSENELLRNLAEGKLLEVRIRKNLDVLSGLVARYRAEQGVPPKKLEQLVEAGYIREVVRDPQGGRYFLGPDAQPLNETLLNLRTRDLRARLEDALQQYHEKHGAKPTKLEDLLEAGLLPNLPLHPWPGRSWRYDPAIGAIQDSE